MEEQRMRKFLKYFLVVVFCLGVGTNVGLATLSLGSWNEGAAGSTHQVWDFTPPSRNPVNPIQFFPEAEFNPNDDGFQVFAQTVLGAWDGTSNLTGNRIIIALKIKNYLNDNDHKEVWVELGLTSGSVSGATLTGSGDGGRFSVIPLQGPGPSGAADFGFYVMPNPYLEDIVISMTGSATGADAVLDWIHVDTICIPEPMTIVLLGLGAIAALRRR
jgi:hypothetical protein